MQPTKCDTIIKIDTRRHYWKEGTLCTVCYYNTVDEGHCAISCESHTQKKKGTEIVPLGALFESLQNQY